MSIRKFHFKKDEYQKYEAFGRKDDNLDYKTSLYLSRNLTFMMKDVHRFSEKIQLYDSTKEAYATVTGYISFQKALMSHLAFIWKDSVPNYPMTMKDMQRTKRQKLIMDQIRDIGADKSRITVVIPRFVSGLFEYPIPSIPIFPLSFAVEYSFCKWAMDNRVQFFSDDREFIEDLLERKQRTLEYTMKTVENDIIPRL